MKTYYTVKPELWNAIMKTYTPYDRTIAECHIANFGIVILDEYHAPLDDECDLTDIDLILSLVESGNIEPHSNGDIITNEYELISEEPQ